MSSTFSCPYCGTQVEDPDTWEWTEEDLYDMDCPSCDRTFEAYITTETIIYCHTETPKELERCEGNCELWSFSLECCMNTLGVSRTLLAIKQHAGFDGVPEWCPLGYDDVNVVQDEESGRWIWQAR